MYIVEAVPLSRGSITEALTYYSAEQFPVGTLITIPIRKSEVQALVVNVQSVSAAKAALRAATFSLRKLGVQKNLSHLPESVLKTAKTLADYYPAEIGAILFALLPPDVRAGVTRYPVHEDLVPTMAESLPPPAVLTGTTVDRYIAYRSYIRQSFARKASVLFVVPTGAHVAKAVAELSHGIEKRVVVFSGTLTKKKLEQSYADFLSKKESILIIATPSYSMLDRSDIGTIVIDESGSSYYRARTRPYLDAREVLKLYAKLTKRSVILGDTLVATEDEIQRREEIYTTFEEHVQRIQFTAPLTIVEKPEQKAPSKKFSILLPETVSAILRTLELKGKVFLFSARRGLAPVVTCYDCGYLFRCPDSGAPYSLIRTQDGEVERRWFISSTSGKKIRAADVCPECGSWRLREQGIGIQHLIDEVSERFPNTPQFVFDATTATTLIKAKKIAHEFSATKSCIVIGTALAVPYFNSDIDLSVITSYEATRSMNTWRADESIFSLISAIRQKTTKDMYVQTRSEPEPLLKSIQKGLIDSFYTEEISVRKALQYPPFSTFILLTTNGTTEQTNSYESTIDATVRTHSVQYYNAPHSTPEKTVRYGLIRIPKSEWPNPELMRALSSLPPFIKIEVNPERIV